MVEIEPSEMQSATKHINVASEVCPWCEQTIPHEKFAEISSRIEERQRERFSEIASQLREQFAHEKADALQDLRTESAASLAAARREERTAAEAIAQQQLAEAERARIENEIALQSKITEAELAKESAEQARTDLHKGLEQLRNESAQTIEVLTQESANREAAAREEAKQLAEIAFQERLAENARMNSEAIATMQAKIEQTEEAKQTIEQQIQTLQERHETVVNDRVQEVREALERDKVEAVNVEKTKAFEENLKLNEKLQQMQRQLEKKTADDLGEGAEIDLYEALKGEFTSDRIERVGKGVAGADIIHVVVHNGQDCGKIVYDSKNRSVWRDEYVAKLAQDQMAAKAEHAILSTHKFPKGCRQLCIQDGVIALNPARVIALIQLLRTHIVRIHTLRLSNEARTQKTAALYKFITSEQCSQLFERIDTHAEDLLELQVTEIKVHEKNWKRQGELIRLVQRVRSQISSEIDQIIGTASAQDEAV